MKDLRPLMLGDCERCTYKNICKYKCAANEMKEVWEEEMEEFSPFTLKCDYFYPIIFNKKRESRVLFNE